MSRYSAKLVKQALENLGFDNNFVSLNKLALALAKELENLDQPIELEERTSASSNTGYRRLFIMRKDLLMSPGKLAAQVAHCAEAYWTNLLRSAESASSGDLHFRICNAVVDGDIWREYVNGSFTKTICEARNKNHLLKAKTMAEELGLVEEKDFGLIWDKCLTELTPEEEDGTTLTGIWFAPLPDEMAHAISRKYQLYR